MRETRNLTLPIIGNVQHGEKIISDGKTRIKEYGHFIAKIKDENMQPYLDKFNQLLKGQKSLNIQFLNNNPFTKKRVRYNQGGQACYCMDNEDIGKVKEKNLWKPIECNSNCDYLKKDANGKTLCNRVGWLKFFIPEIATDRIWLMKITGQQSIDNLDSYLQIQKSQGTLLNKTFTIFLTQKEQINFIGKIFNNYVLDILKKDDFISKPQISQTSQKQENLSTNTTQNVNKSVVKTEQPVENVNVTTLKENTETKKQTSKKATKETKSKSKNAEEHPKEQITEKQNESKDKFNNYYVFESLSSENIPTKDGNSKEYFVGQFYDMKDNPHKIIVKSEFAKELENCELGTVVEILNIQEVGGRRFAIDLNFIQKFQKNIAA